MSREKREEAVRKRWKRKRRENIRVREKRGEEGGKLKGVERKEENSNRVKEEGGEGSPEKSERYERRPEEKREKA